jgi:putative sigma-54 modulation protein
MAPTHITGRNFEVNDKTRSLVETKLGKIRKYFDDIIEIRCVLSVEKYRNICEINIIGKEHDVKALQKGDTMPEAINATVDHLKIRAQKNREKITDHRRKVKSPRASAKSVGDNWTVQVLEPGKLREGRGKTLRPRIIKTSNLPIRPMSIEHAALLLDDSKNEFIVFRDLDTGKVTVIYKRRDNNFGMIAP